MYYFVSVCIFIMRHSHIYLSLLLWILLVNSINNRTTILKKSLFIENILILY